MVPGTIYGVVRCCRPQFDGDLLDMKGIVRICLEKGVAVR